MVAVSTKGQCVSPIRPKFPITPPTSVKKGKKESHRIENEGEQVRKDLISALKKSSLRRCSKPRLKFRPELNFVFDLQGYLDNPRSRDERVAQFVYHAFKYSRNIVAITGAGISVDAGIPDFRSSEGLFSTMKNGKMTYGRQLFDFNYVYSSDDISMRFNRMMADLSLKIKQAVPTGFHKLLDQIAESGRMKRIYTQNIDGLEDRLSHISSIQNPQIKIPMTIQLHGNIGFMSCNKCRKVNEMDLSLFKCDENDEQGSIIPVCPNCEELESIRLIAGKRLQGVGKLRPHVVLYNEIHPEGERIGEILQKDLKMRCDCVLIVGTSLKIPGVKAMCKRFIQSVRSRRGIVLWINKELPSKTIIGFLGGFDLIIMGDCQDLCKIVQNDALSG